MHNSKKRFSKPRPTDAKPSFKRGSEKSNQDKPSKSFDSEKKSFRKNSEVNSDKSYKSFKENKPSSFKTKDGDKRTFGSDKKSFSRKSEERREKSGHEKRKPFDTDKKPFHRKNEERKDKTFNEKRKSFDSDKKPFKRKNGEENNTSFEDKKKSYNSDKKPFRKKDSDGSFGGKSEYNRGYKKTYKKHSEKKNADRVAKSQIIKHDDGLIRLNKYLSNAGICSRREADELIKAGTVTVNGKIITEMGYRVSPDDKINYGGETLRHEKKVYLILNKPKDYITTTDDPRERRTVMELIQGACRERVYPVGRLDRNTTGLLLFTNDGELTTKLMHPKFGIKKVYHVLLDKKIKAEDFNAIKEGLELEDGFIKPDDVSYTGETKKEIGIEIHSGKNRIVRRIFEHLGYEVIKLDRVVFAGLTKKDLPRGKWRILNEKEVSFLKMIG